MVERHHARPNSIEGNKYSEVKNATNNHEEKEAQKVAERIKKTYNIGDEFWWRFSRLNLIYFVIKPIWMEMEMWNKILHITTYNSNQFNHFVSSSFCSPPPSSFVPPGNICTMVQSTMGHQSWPSPSVVSSRPPLASVGASYSSWTLLVRPVLDWNWTQLSLVLLSCCQYPHRNSYLTLWTLYIRLIYVNRNFEACNLYFIGFIHKLVIQASHVSCL